MSTNYAQQFEHDLPPDGPEFWRKLRREGLDCFADLGFPNRRQEAWKYTSVEPVAEGAFQWAPTTTPKALTLEEMHRMAFSVLTGPRLVFLNGHYHAKLSDLSGLPPGVKVHALQQALQEEPEALEARLARAVSLAEAPFAALNTAFLHDGAFVHLPRGAVVKQPIQLLFVSHSNGVSYVSHPRVLVLAEAGSQVSLIETYVGEGTYCTNAVTEIFAGEGAVVEHTKLQGESESAYHLASIGVEQARDSRYTSHSISLGAALARNDLSTRLNAEGADATLNGLYLVSGRQHVDNQTNIDHLKPHGTSVELYKGILDGQAQAVFNGRIVVRPDAQKTSSRQTNKNLILSEDALVNTKPLLEIYANDVKCAHGATIGRLDENQVFYLRSRGIDARLARSLLTYAFASDVLAQLKHEGLRERLQSLMFARLLPGQEVA